MNQEILQENQGNNAKLGKISRNQEIFAELRKFIRKIRKILENQENWKISLGKTAGYQESSPPILGKFGVRPKKKKKGPHLILVGKLGKFSQIRKVHLEDQENQERSLGRLGRLGKFIRKIRKVHSEDQENQESSLGKFLLHIRKIPPPYQENSASKNRLPEAKTLFSTMILATPRITLSIRWSRFLPDQTHMHSVHCHMANMAIYGHQVGLKILKLKISQWASVFSLVYMFQKP